MADPADRSAPSRPRGSRPAAPQGPDDVLEATIRALSAAGDDALSKAAAEGFLDWAEVVDWTERVKLLVLRERQPAALRAELPALAERLERILRTAPQRREADPAVL